VKKTNGNRFFQYQHWIKTPQYTLKKCNSCINPNEQEDCIKRSIYNASAAIKVKIIKLSPTENSFRNVTPTDLIQHKRGQICIGTPEQEHPVLEIRINKIEIELIQNRIKSSTFQKELIQRHDSIINLHTNELHIYTDDFLELNAVDKQNRIIMGAGWILKNRDIEFTCGIAYFLSSTRPELLAIFTALLTVPINNNTHIYTDSQSSINGINNMLQLKQATERKLFKQNNYFLLYAIVDLVLIKKIKLNLHKVKGHSGCIWNDKADSLAKKGRELALENDNRIVDVEFILNKSNFEFIPKWNRIGIDRQVRKFCAHVSDAIYKASWSCNKYWDNIFKDQNNNWY
jgi:ribonuclease HI